MPLPSEPVTEIATEEEPADVADETTSTADAPGVEAPEQAEPDVDETKPAADPFQEFGGQEAVKAAVDFHKRVQTEDGALEAFFMLGRAFGLGINEIEALFRAQQQQAPAAEGPGDDEYVTAKQLREMLAQTSEPLRERLEREAQERVEATAREAIDSELDKLGLADAPGNTKAAILQMGDRYLNEDLSPANVRAAVRKGYEDFKQLVAENAEKYRKDKATQRKAVPKALPGSGAPGGSPEPEPKNVEEAIERARRRLLG